MPKLNTDRSIFRAYKPNEFVCMTVQSMLKTIIELGQILDSKSYPKHRDLEFAIQREQLIKALELP